ncbi:hypothetical protein [Streptomyces niveus]|uniref:hypothetical protein n=1 Tax=Streptomyces niveus TaxID=193462 RepID=UPI0036695AC8
MLPLLLAGFLPTVQEAQRMSALIKSGTPAQATQLVEQAIEDAAARQWTGCRPPGQADG